MTERALTRRILKALNATERCKALKYHGDEYSRVGEPDIIGCYQGNAFVIEVKVGTERPSLVQLRRHAEWRSARAAVAVARENFDVGAFLEKVRHGVQDHPERLKGDRA